MAPGADERVETLEKEGQMCEDVMGVLIIKRGIAIKFADVYRS